MARLVGILRRTLPAADSHAYSSSWKILELTEETSTRREKDGIVIQRDEKCQTTASRLLERQLQLGNRRFTIIRRVRSGKGRARGKW